MKKSQYIMRFLSFFLLFAPVQSILNCQSNRAEEILNTFKRLENKYISVAKERLTNFLNEDPILKENFLLGDSANFKKLKLIIRPVLKFKKEAENYTSNQDIFKLIDFDTVNFNSLAQFYFEDSLVFYITRGHTVCDSYFIPGHNNWCPGELVFFQYFYKSVKINDCFGPAFPIYNDSVFIFLIDCFTEGFLISDNKIKIYPNNYNPVLMPFLNNPNQFIIESYGGEKNVRFFAKGCPDDE